MKTTSNQRRVLICGDRDWSDLPFIRAFVKTLPSGTLVIHGACRGADVYAGMAAAEAGLPCAGMPAHWHVYGNGAGPIRNRWMVEYLAPTEVHAFHDNFGASRGTKDMVEYAKSRDIPVTIHTHGAA